jgi:hypothetical protein
MVKTPARNDAHVTLNTPAQQWQQCQRNNCKAIATLAEVPAQQGQHLQHDVGKIICTMMATTPAKGWQ